MSGMANIFSGGSGLITPPPGILHGDYGINFIFNPCPAGGGVERWKVCPEDFDFYNKKIFILSGKGGAARKIN